MQKRGTESFLDGVSVFDHRKLTTGRQEVSVDRWEGVCVCYWIHTQTHRSRADDDEDDDGSCFNNSGSLSGAARRFFSHMNNWTLLCCWRHLRSCPDVHVYFWKHSFGLASTCKLCFRSLKPFGKLLPGWRCSETLFSVLMCKQGKIFGCELIMLWWRVVFFSFSNLFFTPISFI